MAQKFSEIAATIAAVLALSTTALAQVPVAPAAPAAPAPKAASNQDDGYVLGSGDVVEVDVLGQADFRTRGRIRADGTIVVPFLGSIAASGDTTLTFAKKISAALAKGGYYNNPIVNVEIASYASRYVIVLGEVGSAGLQPVDRAYRVSEIIARSGGIRPSGADYVIVRRENGEELKLPFEKLAAGSNADDPFVNPGDKIYVPAAPTFFVYGQIAAPGEYSLRNEMTLRKAVARGGGLGPNGSEKRISVYRDGKKQPMTMDTKIQPGDVINVGERLF